MKKHPLGVFFYFKSLVCFNSQIERYRDKDKIK
jgi:hypothetical protein